MKISVRYYYIHILIFNPKFLWCPGWNICIVKDRLSERGVHIRVSESSKGFSRGMHLSVHRVPFYAMCSDEDSRFPDRINDRALIHSAYTYISLWCTVALRVSPVDSFAADLSLRLLGNCLGRGRRAQAVCYRHYGNLPRVNAGDLSLHISQAFFDGCVVVVGTHNRVENPDVDIQFLVKLNVLYARSSKRKKKSTVVHPLRQSHFFLKTHKEFWNINVWICPIVYLDIGIVWR